MLTAAFGKAAVMANEDKKDFNSMLNDSKDMPKIQIITDEKSIKNTAGTECILLHPSITTK